MDQLGSLVCFPVREVLPAQWIDDDLLHVFHVRENLLAWWIVLHRLKQGFDGQAAVQKGDRGPNRKEVRKSG